MRFHMRSDGKGVVERWRVGVLLRSFDKMHVKDQSSSVPSIQHSTTFWIVALGVTAILLLIRWPLHFIHILPHFISFRPDACLTPMAGVLGGPAAVWGVFAATLMGDWWFGDWGGMSVFRAIGQALFAYSAWRLWPFTWWRAGKRPAPDTSWQSMGRFVTVSFPGAWIAAAWTALGAEWGRTYPFAYVFGIVLAQNLLFIFLLGPPIYELVVRWMVKRQGPAIPVSSVCPLRDAGLMLMGGMGAGLAGILLSTMVYDMPVFQPTRLGGTSGAWMKIVVSLLCVAPWVPVFWRKKRRDAERS